jgi:AraC family transcriptional regulator
MAGMSAQDDQTSLYSQRIDAVISHVREHLDEALTLDRLARVAGFSPFHFHRVFRSMTGERINDMVMRLRVERAVMLLRSTRGLTITGAAFASGFRSASVFSRVFRKHYGISARAWDRVSPLTDRKIGQVMTGGDNYTPGPSDIFNVELRRLPAQTLAYVRLYSARGSMTLVQAYERLLDWFQKQGGDLNKTTLYGMSQDDPEITPERLCRFDWCLRVPDGWRGQGGVNVISFPACTVAVLPCNGDVSLEYKNFLYLFTHWLPRSGYQPANLPGMEIYRRLPSETGWEYFDLDCAVPVELL